MKVLHVIQRYYPAIGGSEVWCRGLSRYLVKHGCEVKVLTTDVYNEDEFWADPPIENCAARLGKVEYDKDVLIRRYKRTKIHPFFYNIFERFFDKILNIYFYGPHSIEMYIKLIKEIWEADIVHLHTIPYPHNFIAFIIAKFYGKKVAITPHFHPGHKFYERPSNYWLLRKSDAVFTVSDYEKEHLVKNGVSEVKITVSANALHMEDYGNCKIGGFKEEICRRHGIETGTRILIFIGRKIEYKGIEKLVDAARNIKKRYPLKLFLVGPSFPWFEKYYSKLSDDDKKDIIDFGTVSEEVKINLLRMSDALVLPSKHEAFGIVFLEAWACNVPVIGPDKGAIPAIIKDGGLVFDYDNEKSLEEKIELLLEDRGLAAKLAHQGNKKLLLKYTWDKAGADILNTYSFLIKSPARLLKSFINMDIEKLLGKGWYAIEHNETGKFAWSKKKAYLDLKNKDGLMLYISAFMPSVQSPVKLVLFDVDGKINPVDYKITGSGIIEARVPSGMQKIKLSVSELRQPKAMAGIDDERYLGVCLHGIGESRYQGEICRFAPLVFEVETSTLCNINPPCVMCEERALGLIGKKDANISDEIIKKIEPYMKAAHTVSLHGQGEPLLYKNLLDVMGGLKGRNICVKFNTNGLLLTRDMSERLVMNGMREISISLDAATPKTYLRIRRNNGFDTIKQNIKEMVNAKKKHGTRFPLIELNMTVMKENLKEAVDFARLAKNLGADSVYYSLLKPRIESYKIESLNGFIFDYTAQMICPDSIAFKKEMSMLEDECRALGLEFRADYRGILDAVLSDM